MQKELLISVDENEVQTALLENGVLEELHIERRAKGRIAGSIYKGKVKKVVPGIDAAFINIGLKKDGFLYVSDTVKELNEVEAKLPERRIKDMVRKGDEILVQVTKEPMRAKGARLSSHIALPGRFLVLMPTVEDIGVSRRITDERERRRLRSLLKGLKPQGMGLIVRTAGEGKGKKEFLPDIKYLTNVWRRIQRQAKRAKTPQLIHQEFGLLYRVIRDSYTEDVDRVLIDSKAEYGRLRRYLHNLLPNSKPRIELHKGKEPLFSLYNLEGEIENTLQRKVQLPSGGYLIIEEVEAMSTIDVNSGRYVGREGLEKTVLKTNLEAAQEVARQLRLRDIGGIIVIDFIDMESRENQRKVLRKLTSALRRDRAKTKILQLTELGLVEMTRQRVRESLQSALCQPCPYCEGRGSVRSVETTSIMVQRRLRKICLTSAERRILVRAHPEVAFSLLKVKRRIERNLRRRVEIEEDPDFHLEEVKILSAKTGSSLDT